MDIEDSNSYEADAVNRIPHVTIVPRPYGHGAHAKFTMRKSIWGVGWVLVVRDQIGPGKHRKPDLDGGPW
ncbi:hypothetical protein SEA_QBERT_15 [Mycobacterium phage QBert]|uniref:Uncharacterized protein n=1 Tax=Mycobacterium phage QBert TaxID=2502469 RepID=A0A411CBR5_9CAUD|nr:hypothetical protein KHO63_gp015 [Mycobacterium phage QBert]QAY11280.1 hypothetical protein SEA_QBERT_15 [Mycobacterium phage QBert]